MKMPHVSAVNMSSFGVSHWYIRRCPRSQMVGRASLSSEKANRS